STRGEKRQGRSSASRGERTATSANRQGIYEPPRAAGESGADPRARAVVGLEALLEVVDLFPAHGERVEDDDLERDDRERPQRVAAVAQPAELAQQVDQQDDDREPAGPAALRREPERREEQEGAPEAHDPAPR